ncbi:MAG: Beta-glucuronidase [Rhodospirillales bacterium]|nr:Beta-glucuronidase [Rhodospirillales bacterium]
MRLEPGDGGFEKCHGAFLLLVGHHGGEGQSRRVVDGDLEVSPAGAGLSALAVAIIADAVANAVAAPKLFDVDVDQLARVLALVADDLGVLVMNKIPAVGLNFEDPPEATAQRLTQATRQIRELIARDKNHPSTIMWVVANEPRGGPVLGAGPPVPSAVESGMRFFQQMYDETRRLDPTRPVTLVGVKGGPLDWHGIFDVVAINRYYGWYTHGGRLDEGAEVLARGLDDLNARFAKPIVMTEFGTDTIPACMPSHPRCGRRNTRSSTCADTSTLRLSGLSLRACRCGTSPTSRPARARAAPAA